MNVPIRLCYTCSWTKGDGIPCISFHKDITKKDCGVLDKLAATGVIEALEVRYLIEKSID